MGTWARGRWALQGTSRSESRGPEGNQHNNYSADLLPITPAKPLKTERRAPITLTWNIALFHTNRRRTTTRTLRKWFLSRNERYYVFTTLLSSVSRFVIILWIFRGFGRPWGWNPSKHKRGNADGEFQNNMILSRRLGGPNKIYLNINAHRGVHYLEVLSKHGRYIPSLSLSAFNNRHWRPTGCQVVFRKLLYCLWVSDCDIFGFMVTKEQP